MAATSHRTVRPYPGSWLLFSILFAARTSIAYQFQSVPTVAPHFRDVLGMSHASIGLLIGCFMLPGVLLAIPGGLLDRRLGSRRTLIGGLAAMVVGGFAMTSADQVVLFGGRLVSGGGAVILNVVLAKIVADRFAGRLVAVMGGIVASWPFGIALALVSLPWVAETGGSTAAMSLATLPAVASLIAVWLLLPETQHRLGESGKQATISRSAIGLALTAGLVWGCYNAAYVIIVANLPDFLVGKGYSVPISATIASVLGWVLILTLPTGGIVTGRMGRPIVAMVVCLLSVGILATLLVTESTVLFWIVMMALVVGLPAGLIMALPGQVLAADDRALGLGLFFTAFYACMAILPAVSGAIRNKAATPAAALLCGGACAILAAAWLLPFAHLRRRATRRHVG